MIAVVARPPSARAVPSTSPDTSLPSSSPPSPPPPPPPPAAKTGTAVNAAATLRHQRLGVFAPADSRNALLLPNINSSGPTTRE